MLLENGFKDIHVDVVECDVVSLVGPKMTLPPKGLDAATNLLAELSTAIGRCISTEKDLQSQGTQGLWLEKSGDPDAVYALTSRHVVEPLPGPDAKMSNKEYRYKENSGAPKVDICLLGDQYHNDLGQDDVIEAETERADEEDLDEDARDDARRNVDKAKKRKQMAQDFAEELKQWEDPEKRCIGHVDFAPPYEVKPAGHEVDVAIIAYDTRKLPDDQKKPRNIIHIGDNYSWEEVKRLLNSDLSNRFKFPINANGQITLTTKVVTHKALANPPEDMFDATKFTMGVANEAVLGRQARLPDGTVKMAVDFSILSLSRKYANFNKVHGDFSAAGDSGAPIGDQKRELVGQIIASVGRHSSVITIITPMEDIKAD
ncbi:hypothetical protein M378DRAFT_168994 [Amanita muscaria Koide BX008]|uniref:Uncharacterized protein n=1 Tax=Amanita muscaria (strain Koide BX008) TaxID=946122 RepID=A0A0C2WSI6_AMAMK|nr:hypothetical protein M378DRAFT_168994 [Amanita muscaria Koide BX008]